MAHPPFPASNPATQSRQRQRTERPHQLERWAGYDDGPDMRFASLGQYSLPGAPVHSPASVSDRSTSAKSISSNDFLSNPSTTSTGYLQPPSMPGAAPVGKAPHSIPSLISSGTTASTASVKTRSTAGLAYQEQLEERDGIPQRTAPRLECLLGNILDCYERFADERAWRLHHLIHFRGASPPQSVSCPYPGCGSVYSPSDGRGGWEHLMDHVESWHAGGQSIHTVRVDRDLLQFLWRERLITSSMYQQKRIGTTAPLLWGQSSGPREARHEIRQH